jgi:uncharacterized protein YecE (DUF72 family)
MISEYKLQIGSYGWRYEAWDNSFYPEDLPGDWQFAYYSNEYTVILIPWDMFQTNFELLKQGIDDSDDNCRLLFEFPISNIKSNSDELLTALHDFLTKISFTGSRCMGIVLVIQESELMQLSSENLDLVKKLLETSQAKINTCIEIPDLIISEPIDNSFQKELLSILNLTGTDICRVDDNELTILKGDKSKLHITYCDKADVTPKQMRKIVENSLVGECEDSTNVLIFRSEIPKHELMNTATVISDLL